MYANLQLFGAVWIQLRHAHSYNNMTSTQCLTYVYLKHWFLYHRPYLHVTLRYCQVFELAARLKRLLLLAQPQYYTNQRHRHTHIQIRIYIHASIQSPRDHAVLDLDFGFSFSSFRVFSIERWVILCARWRLQVRDV